MRCVTFWTIRPDISNEGIHVLVKFELIQSQTFSEIQHTHVSTDKDYSNIRQHVTAITQMVSDEPSILYLVIKEDDEDNDNSDEGYGVSSASDDDNNPNDEEDDINFGSGEQINDLTESSTITLLDWNDAMTDLQLGMRFTKEHTYLVQVHQNKHRNMTLKFISKLISHLVANDSKILVSNVIQEVQVLLQTGCTYKRAWYARKFAVERMFDS
ncbi:hypothetical protein M9H77_02769 [Catharanthus roseus]|uniref:Uncharacterized protein n=1 Tax=Catharanthus roseus TaxID=4058 RepID=A0ACC0C9E2_CATRO|nr:hypothetical protein M9H77_02769 [Catharanthus roseus]